MGAQWRETARAGLLGVPINTGFAQAVVDGTVDGELWCDRVADPRAFHAVHPYGMSLVWGDAVGDAAPRVAERLRARAADGTGEWLQVEPRWAGLDWDGLLGAVPLADHRPGDPAVRAVRHTRLNFAFDEGRHVASRGTRSASSSGRTVRRATAADFAWDGGVVPGGFWPDADAFLDAGGGWVIEADGTPAAIAFAAYRVDDEVELGIETAPAFRRRGCAAQAAAAMIDDLLASGRTPVWSCREDNVGSVRLAESLGFVPTLRLPYYRVLGAGERVLSAYTV